jgi:hypothetical protein
MRSRAQVLTAAADGEERTCVEAVAPARSFACVRQHVCKSILRMPDQEADRCLLLAHRENSDEVPVARNCSSLLRVIVPAQKKGARIAGRGTDLSGAVIVGAECKIANIETSVSTIAATRRQDIHHPRLASSHLMAEHSEGRLSHRRPVLPATLRENVVNEDFTLAIGPTSESVNIVGAPLLQTDSLAVSTVVDDQFLRRSAVAVCRRRRKIRSYSFYTASAREAVAPVYQAIINALPLPTGPPVDPACDNIANPCMANSVVYSNASNINATSTRVDHSLSSKITSFARYNHTPSRDLGFWQGGHHHERSPGRRGGWRTERTVPIRGSRSAQFTVNMLF